MNPKRRVYVVNLSAHDFSPAEEYGELVFLSEGPMNRYSVNNMYRLFEKMLRASLPEDYIVPCSLNVMNSIACAIFAHKHGRLNLLLYKNGTYVERNLVFGKGGEANAYYGANSEALEEGCTSGSS